GLRPGGVRSIGFDLLAVTIGAPTDKSARPSPSNTANSRRTSVRLKLTRRGGYPAGSGTTARTAHREDPSAQQRHTSRRTRADAHEERHTRRGTRRNDGHNRPPGPP